MSEELIVKGGRWEGKGVVGMVVYYKLRFFFKRNFIFVSWYFGSSGIYLCFLVSKSISKFNFLFRKFHKNFLIIIIIIIIIIVITISSLA